MSQAFLIFMVVALGLLLTGFLDKWPLFSKKEDDDDERKDNNRDSP
jgi:hypothetical protein